MISFLETVLSEFRSCFSRKAAYHWFVVVILGLLTRMDKLGVTSFIRALSINGQYYECMLHFLRSSAYTLDGLKTKWYSILKSSDCLLHFEGRIFLAVPALKRLAELCGNEDLLHIITMAKMNCIAYEEPDIPSAKKRGRPRKKSKTIKLAELFESEKDKFKETVATLYRQEETISYLCKDLLWGNGLYKNFVSYLSDAAIPEGSLSVLISLLILLRS